MQQLDGITMVGTGKKQQHQIPQTNTKIELPTSYAYHLGITNGAVLLGPKPCRFDQVA
jgi:hypothetical protein